MGDKETLDSWKEIAVYIKRSVTTCRRLEQELGLPIHRLEETPKARVFAYKEEIDGWTKKTQHSEKKAFIGKIGLKQRFIPAMVIVALAITAVIIWQLLPPKEAVLIPSDKPSLAIMYFKNETGDESLDHWRSALCQWLITDLSQSKHINVLPMDRMISILRKCSLLDAKTYSSEDLKRVASEGRVNHIFQAGLSRAGDTFRIDYSLHASDILEPIGSSYVKGEGEESLHTLVDELTRKIKENFKLSAKEILSDIDKKVGKITTSSPEAYKFYSEGVKYNNKGEYRLSIRFLERAIAIDSEFAMAYRVKAACYWDLGNVPKWKESIQKALEFSDRTSERERYLIQGHFYTWSGSGKTFDKAIEAFDKLLLLYPDDFMGNKNLGNLYMRLEQWDKAIERFKVTIENKTDSIWPYSNAAQAYMAKGSYDDAKEVLEHYIDNFSDNYVIRDRLAMNYFNQGKLDLALAEINKAISLNPVVFSIIKHKGDIFHYKGDLIKAEREYQKLLESDEISDQLSSRSILGALYVLQGRFIESKEMKKQGLELAEWGW